MGPETLVINSPLDTEAPSRFSSVKGNAGPYPAEDGLEYRQTRQDQVFLGPYRRGRPRVLGNRRLRGDVAAAEVFGQRQIDQGDDMRGQFHLLDSRPVVR